MPQASYSALGLALSRFRKPRDGGRHTGRGTAPLSDVSASGYMCSTYFSWRTRLDCGHFMLRATARGAPRAARALVPPPRQHFFSELAPPKKRGAPYSPYRKRPPCRSSFSCLEPACLLGVDADDARETRRPET